MGSKNRTPLSRQRILNAAIKVADTAGIQSLSMRKVADELHVEAMSLYHHVANKGEMLDGIVDTLFSKIELPDQQKNWKDAMRTRAHSVRSVLAAHPWAIELMDSRNTSGPSTEAIQTATLVHHNAMLGSLRNGGFSVAMSAHAFSVIDSYIYGFVIQEANLPFESSDELEEVTDDLQLETMADDLPHLAELVSEHILQPDYSYADEFDFGLDLILDALQRQLDTANS